MDILKLRMDNKIVKGFATYSEKSADTAAYELAHREKKTVTVIRLPRER